MVDVTPEAKHQLRTGVVERLKKGQTVYLLTDGRATQDRPANPKVLDKVMTWAAWRVQKLDKNMARLKAKGKLTGRGPFALAENEFERNLIVKLAPEFEIDLMGVAK